MVFFCYASSTIRQHSFFDLKTRFYYRISTWKKVCC